MVQDHWQPSSPPTASTGVVVKKEKEEEGTGGYEGQEDVNLEDAEEVVLAHALAKITRPRQFYRMACPFGPHNSPLVYTKKMQNCV